LRVGVVGMGAGTLAAYGQAGDSYRFYEIDPEIAGLSEGVNPTFTFLQGSAAHSEVRIGDARVLLQDEASHGDFQKFDVLAVDAFSGDAVPVHLVTREAMALYLRHLRGSESVVAFHLTNRSLDLLPVVEALRRDYNLVGV
jgi:spermidine synthase